MRDPTEQHLQQPALLSDKNIALVQIVSTPSGTSKGMHSK